MHLLPLSRNLGFYTNWCTVSCRRPALIRSCQWCNQWKLGYCIRGTEKVTFCDVNQRIHRNAVILDVSAWLLRLVRNAVGRAYWRFSQLINHSQAWWFSDTAQLCFERGKQYRDHLQRCCCWCPRTIGYPVGQLFKRTRSGLTVLSRHTMGTHQVKELTRNSSGNTRSRSSQLTEPLWEWKIH